MTKVRKIAFEEHFTAVGFGDYPRHSYSISIRALPPNWARA